jgi:hypothetical protein
MPTGEPQRGQIERREAISSRALRCFPQVQMNLMVMTGRDQIPIPKHQKPNKKQ